MDPSATLLHWLRRPGDERQLTDCVGEAARLDGGLARGLAEALLQTVTEGLGADRAVALLESLPDEVGCEPEDWATGAPSARRRLGGRERPPASGRIDWVLHDRGPEPRWHLAVEVKIGAGLGPDQLRTYHEHMSRKAGQKGLMVLARSWPGTGLLCETENRHWLGVSLWEQAFPFLHAVRPTNVQLGSQWPLLMSVLEDRDDLGVPPVTWSGLARGAEEVKPMLARLASLLQPEALQHLRTLLKRRPAALGCRSELLASATLSRRGNRPSIKLQVPARSREAVRIRFSVQGGALIVAVAVHPPRRPKIGSGRAKHDAARQQLLAAGFTIDYPWIGLEAELKPRDENPRRAAISRIKDHLALIVRTGMLDDDVKAA